MDKVLISVYCVKNRSYDRLQIIADAMHVLNPEKFVHVANVLVDIGAPTKMLEGAFHILSDPTETTSTWSNPAVTTVGMLDPEFGNRLPHSGDVFIIQDQVYVAQTFGWTHVGQFVIETVNE